MFTECPLFSGKMILILLVINLLTLPSVFNAPKRDEMVQKRMQGIYRPFVLNICTKRYKASNMVTSVTAILNIYSNNFWANFDNNI